MNETSATNRSYAIRRQLITLGIISGENSLLARDHLMLAEIDGTEIDCILLGITNAGFNGIIAHIELADGSRRSISLGHITNPAH